MSIDFRAAGPADDAGIRALLAANFPDNVKARPEFTRWQYWDNPFGRTVSWVAEANRKIVAHWAAVPVPLRLAGRLARGAKGVDIATDPDFRGQGLFTGVGERMLADCADHGIQALLSHPNPDAAHGAERAGAVLVSRISVYVRPLDSGWLAERLRVPAPAGRLLARAAFSLGAGDQGEITKAPPDGLDALWALAGASVSNGVQRDAAWWRWRYVDRPERPYRFAVTRSGGRLTGVAAVTVAERFGGRFGLVLEYLAVNDTAARGLTRTLGEAAASDGAMGLALATIPGSPLAQLATGAGFRKLPRRLEPRPLRFMVVDPMGDTAALAARDWAMAWGDLDHL